MQEPSNRQAAAAPAPPPDPVSSGFSAGPGRLDPLDLPGHGEGLYAPVFRIYPGGRAHAM